MTNKRQTARDKMKKDKPKMTYDDIRKGLAFWIDILRDARTGISSKGRIPARVDALNGSENVLRIIRSLEKRLDKHDDTTIRRRCDNVKNSAQKLQDILLDFLDTSAGRIKITARLNDLIAELDGLLDSLAEASQSQPGHEEDEHQESNVRGMSWQIAKTKAEKYVKDERSGFPGIASIRPSNRPFESC